MEPYYETKLGKLYHGDCLEIMPQLGPVDLVLTDPPYGIIACKWDSVIPFKPMWKQIKHIIKPNGATVLCGYEPFSSVLRISNIEDYKYDWIWEKNIPTGVMLAKRQPMRKHELISVFYKKQCCYNRQMIKRTNREFKKSYRKNDSIKGISEHYVSMKTRQSIERQWYKPPVTILRFDSDKKRNGKGHPTQKPVALMEYLIKTYTNEDETVLDFAIGSGTTAVACERLNRRWIGIEIEEKYCEIAAKRIEQETKQLQLWN